MPIEISNHSEYLLEKRAEKYSPITYLGTVHQGYCSVISKVIAWYLLSRAGVYYKNNSIVELEKSIGYRDTKSVSHRVSNLNALMSSLSRENILDTLDKFGELIYSDYKYQNSTTYDLEYDGVRYPPKVIFGISAIALINRPLFADEFSGGVNSPCFHILEALGFNIVKKNKSSDGNEFEDIDFLINDIEMIGNDDSLSVTEREQLIAARKGQGKYRKELIKLYGKYIVTGIPYEFMLRASHIKPWRVSNNKERLDPFNGFLLSSNVDILFDKGFLSFENSGELILCDELKNEFTLRLLGIDLRKKVMIPLGTFQYLDWHRKNVFGRCKGK
ncbi:HNH endonuclease [Salmonella enterica]|nr:HNH endonuclease [Salmonella enterica]